MHGGVPQPAGAVLPHTGSRDRGWVGLRSARPFLDGGGLSADTSAMDADDTPIEAGAAGASANREYERRSQRRKQHAKEKLGGLGVLLAHVIEKPQSTRAWQQGANGEARAGARLARHLDGRGVRLLHDRRVPGHGQANIDHLAVGPGGITVIDTKTQQGKLHVDRIGGLLAPRCTRLLIDGRDRTRLIDAVENQVEHVRAALARSRTDDINIRGALCFPEPAGLPLFGQLSVRGIMIDGPKPVAKLARRPGQLSPEAIESIWRDLARSLPQA
jgi:hypothetical protein